MEFTQEALQASFARTEKGRGKRTEEYEYEQDN